MRIALRLYRGGEKSIDDVRKPLKVFSNFASTRTKSIIELNTTCPASVRRKINLKDSENSDCIHHILPFPLPSPPSVGPSGGNASPPSFRLCSSTRLSCIASSRSESSI